MYYLHIYYIEKVLIKKKLIQHHIQAQKVSYQHLEMLTLDQPILSPRLSISP